MSAIFDSATDAEDAYYDAIDEGDLKKMMSVWADSADIACLLPMHPMHLGQRAIRELWQSLFEQEMEFDIIVNHLQWIEQGDVAIHLLEEVVTVKGDKQSQPAVYASNVYHRDSGGWHLLLHLNSPTPPPSGVLPPIPDS